MRYVLIQRSASHLYTLLLERFCCVTSDLLDLPCCGARESAQSPGAQAQVLYDIQDHLFFPLHAFTSMSLLSC